MRVVQLWRYPVKSMGGEQLDVAHVAPRIGIAGDRAYAVVDPKTGTVASAKHPRKWGGLLAYRASLHDDTLVVRDADGAIVANATWMLSATPTVKPAYEELQADGTEKLDTMAGAAPRTFFDYAPIHLVTTATLARMHELLPGSQLDVARFRPNLVVDTGDEPGFVENEWLGSTLAIGDVRLDVMFTCPRCVMTTLEQPGVPADPAVLRAATDHNTQVFSPSGKRYPTIGVYATVTAGGTIRAGDVVTLARSGHASS